MTDFLHAPGFLGTSANFAADMTLTLSILVAVIFTWGGAIAKKMQHVEARFKKGDPGYEAAMAEGGRLFTRHRWMQTTGAIINLILVLWLMLLPYRDFVIRDLTSPPPERTGLFYWVTSLHAAIGFFAFVIGNYVVLRGNNLMIAKLKFTNYKPWMRAAYILYMLTTLVGIWVYITWFITIANPPVF